MKFSPSTQGFYPDVATLPKDLVSITEADYLLGLQGRPVGSTLAIKKGALVIVPPPDPTAAEILADLVIKAKIELDAVTGARGVVIRCYIAGIALPTDWVDYITALRNIINGTDTTSTSLPTKPAYPSGT